MDTGSTHTFKVGVYRGDQRVGQIVFHTLLVTKAGDYQCHPAGILPHADVIQISTQLRRLPAVLGGRIGDYSWKEE